MKRLTAGILLGLWFSGLCSAQKKCYYPNGLEAANDHPCDPSDTNSACCGGGLGAVCLTNKLCRSPDGNTIRGSCTDKSWASADCPQYCLGAKTGGTDLVSCSNVTKTDTSYCCDGFRAFCCDEGVARFDVFPSNPQILARWDADSTKYVKVAQQTSSSSSSSSSSASSQASTTSATGTTPASISSSTSSTATSTSDASTQPQSSSQSLSTAAQAGIGVGAAVLALALAAVAFLLFKLRKKKARLTELETQQQQQQQQYQGSGPNLEYKYDTGAGYYPRPELAEGVPRQEMEAQTPTFELPVTTPRPGRGY